VVVSDASRLIGVVVCDDDPEMRAVLVDALAEEDAITIVGQAGNGRDCVRMARRLQPDVILLDLSMPKMGGLEAIPRIATAAPRSGILVLSGLCADRMCGVALARGADRYIEKGADLGELLGAVREVADRRRRGHGHR
jgi:DNA-binding NarL/FixJ family response regulator